MKQERRYLTQEFRVSQDGAPVIQGYAAVFDTPSNDMGWTEEIDPHAFDSVMTSRPDVRALWNHNPDFVLGRTISGTLKLDLDARGLAYTINAPDTTVARDLVVSMRRGDVTQSSFSFITKRDQWTDNTDGTVTRRILEFEALWDVSPVTYPAYDQASATVRSLPETMPAEMRSRFEPHNAAATTENETRALTDQCTCTCPQCMASACGICSADPICAGAERSSARSWQADAMLRLRFAEAE
jgi:hypothetical protein